jgi:acetylornithine deacetylase
LALFFYVYLWMKTADFPLHEKAILLLEKLIETPSFSKEEEKTADLIYAELLGEGVKNIEKIGNNVIAKNLFFDPNKPTILLNSHHDTVKPNASYNRDPFVATQEGDKLYGLGSNDAGGPLVSLWATFLYFYEVPGLAFNLVFVASAEEEISGKNGIESILSYLPKINLAIVGEPTGMNLAIAEKGLMVLDCTAKGVAGHAARNEGENAILIALTDIQFLSNYTFEKTSTTLGPVKMSVTLINAGTQHNVVPDSCTFVVDVRLTDAYTAEEVIDILKKHLKSEIVPRSTRLKPSGISAEHPIVKKGISLGLKTYGSPTLSDQALMPFTSIKIGPGESERSHTADEYILMSEIKQGIETYINLLTDLVI